MRLFSVEMRLKLKNIPCHSEFIKYVSWHNNVVEMSWGRGYKSIQVYFEDYADENRKLEEAKKMANFLGYDVKHTELPKYLGGKTYKDGFYTEEEVEHLKDFIQSASSVRTWELLQRYF